MSKNQHAQWPVLDLARRISAWRQNDPTIMHIPKADMLLAAHLIGEGYAPTPGNSLMSKAIDELVDGEELDPQ